jgi:GntR family transcriptional regulator, transcriptional repressor for pyruvate dehydrogenase complex
MSSQKKVYIEIIDKIHDIINQDELKAGDKLPSERELSDRLNVGRSSVREALRSLELLGLIETRRGEGTFIVDANEYQLIEILGTFVLQSDKVIEDLIELKNMIEMTALPLACIRMEDDEITELASVCKELVAKPSEEVILSFHRKIVEGSHNRLLVRVWNILYQYYKNSGQQTNLENTSSYEKLLASIVERDASKSLIWLKKVLEDDEALV